MGFQMMLAFLLILCRNPSFSFHIATSRIRDTPLPQITLVYQSHKNIDILATLYFRTLGTVI